MENILIKQWYQKMNLGSNINIYYCWHMYDLNWYGEKNYLNELLFWCDSLDQIQQYITWFYKRDSDLNLIARDVLTNEVLIYVNPIGTRPLYINDSNFISPSIEDLIDKNSKLDYQYLGQIRWFGYNQNDLTPWTNIRRLLPWFIYRGNIYKLWKDLRSIRLPNNVSTNWMLPDYLWESVIARLHSVKDETIWVLVSGWLDSSVITALLLRANKEMIDEKKIRFFTTENAQDLDYASELSEYLGFKLELIPGDDVELTDEEIFEVNETPVDLGSVIPNMKLFKRIASMWIHTIFTWDWPDEMFRWYRRNAESFDYHESDMKNELVYYHFPKLEKAARYYNIDLITPYVCTNLWYMVQNHEVKPFKQDLKEYAHWLIPESIIGRTKEPLKNNQIRENKKEYQEWFLDRFISYAKKLWESIQTIKK